MAPLGCSLGQVCSVAQHHAPVPLADHQDYPTGPLGKADLAASQLHFQRSTSPLLATTVGHQLRVRKRIPLRQSALLNGHKHSTARAAGALLRSSWPIVSLSSYHGGALIHAKRWKMEQQDSTGGRWSLAYRTVTFIEQIPDYPRTSELKQFDREILRMVDETKLHQFIGQMLSDLGGAASVGLVKIGDALGLYKTLHVRGPMTVGSLPSRQG